MRQAALWMGWWLCACNRVAVLDVELDLPPAPLEAEFFAQVQAARADLPFDVDWEGGASLPSVRLSPTRQTYAFSLFTEKPETDVHVRVRYCRERECTFVPALGDDAPADPVAEVRYVLEHPFYIQTRSPDVTTWRTTLSTVPTCAMCGESSDCPRGTCVDGVCQEDLNCVAAPLDGCEPLAADRPSILCRVDKCDIGCGSIAGTPAAGYCDDGPRGERIHFCEQ